MKVSVDLGKKLDFLGYGVTCGGNLIIPLYPTR